MKSGPLSTALAWMASVAFSAGIPSDLIAGTPPAGPEYAQDSGFQIIDFVEAPAGWIPGAAGDSFLEFSESWVVKPGSCSLFKKVNRFTAEPGDHESDPGGMKSVEVTYEFNFLDPHLPESGDRDVWEPGMMDPFAKELQEAFIQLVTSCLYEGRAFDLQDMLLSVIFHETWEYEPEHRILSKEVWAITPVIWQRRRTVKGDPVNEGDTGMPVYYKTELPRIRLRNR